MDQLVSQIKPFGLRAPAELMEWVRQRAAQAERSSNYVITAILREAKEREERRKK